MLIYGLLIELHKRIEAWELVHLGGWNNRKKVGGKRNVWFC